MKAPVSPNVKWSGGCKIRILIWPLVSGSNQNRPFLEIEVSVNRTIDSMHPSCLGIMQVAFLGGFDDTKLPSCRCDVNGSMTVSKTVRLGSNPSTDASFSKDRLCMKRQSKRS